MINIFSHDSPEVTTELVMDWLHHYGVTYKRINGVDIINNIHFCIEINNVNGVKLSNHNLDSTFSWFRKWMIFDHLEDTISDCGDYLRRDIAKLTKSEARGVSTAFFYASKESNWYDLPPFLKEYPNKTEQLDKARNAGLIFPDSIITNNKKSLIQFYEKIGRAKIIIKPIREVELIGDDKGNFFVPYTTEISRHLNQIPDFFFPTLFQKSIDKEFEVRIFYFEKKCYSMGIFSNRDEQTKGDFRRYNWNKPNRNVPIIIPNSLEEKIVIFMESIDLKTGSLDFLYNEQDGYSFLEVNPTGQFGMVSFPCNYYIEEIIAKTFINIQKT
jgi:ATP-GRASP peptide maturase of grasp-with-spasm system